MSTKNILRLIVIVGIISAIYYLESQKAPQPNKETGIQAEQKIKDTQQATEKELSGVEAEKNKLRRETKAKQYELAKEISTPDGFVNTKNITISELIGKKVILVDFWTSSCINCRRTIPYLNAWYEKYRDQGLEIIGIHTPEFEYEHDYNKVAEETRALGIKYPVVLDNDFSTWQAYKNRYWPRKYLIDIDGFIIYDHAGEGSYEETEIKIQEALKERMKVLEVRGQIAPTVSAPKDAESVDFARVASPEIYFGAARNEFLGNGVPLTLGTQTFKAPAKLEANKLYLVGDWHFTQEFAENKSSQAKIIFRYRAQKVFMVAGADRLMRVKIIKDGELLTVPVAVKTETLYRLIEDSSPGEHTLELLIEEPGLRAFTFTFG